jgi:GT2 family glycosyltransferase
MALIAMAVYDTEENKRTEYTAKTLTSLYLTVNPNKHRIVIVDNGSCEATQDLLSKTARIEVIRLHENIGTAKAVNKAWQLRKPNEHCIKMDNDVVIHQSGWVDQMERALAIDTTIGIIGLKRKDCWEEPSRTDFYQSKLQMLKMIKVC